MLNKSPTNQFYRKTTAQLSDSLSFPRWWIVRRSCMAPTEHLKMMRLLVLCLLLLLPAATAVSEDTEGSADGGPIEDDEDLYRQTVIPKLQSPDSDKTTGLTETPDQFTMIMIIVAVAVLTLSGAAIVTVLLVRRHLHNRQQGIYFVPTEQDQKGAV